MAKKKSMAELQAENRILRQHALGSSLTKVFTEAVKYGGYVAIARYCYKSVSALAGKITLTDISVNPGIPQHETKALLLGVLTGSMGIFVAGIGIMYALWQRSLRRNTIEMLSVRIQELEKRQDPGRSSSHLSSTGETNLRDR